MRLIQLFCSWPFLISVHMLLYSETVTIFMVIILNIGYTLWKHKDLLIHTALFFVYRVFGHFNSFYVYFQNAFHQLHNILSPISMSVARSSPKTIFYHPASCQTIQTSFPPSLQFCRIAISSDLKWENIHEELLCTIYKGIWKQFEMHSLKVVCMLVFRMFPMPARPSHRGRCKPENLISTSTGPVFWACEQATWWWLLKADSHTPSTAWGDILPHTIKRLVLFQDSHSALLPPTPFIRCCWEKHSRD